MTAAIRVPVTAVWTSPDAPRDEDAPMVAPAPDPVAWNRNLLGAPPSALHGRTVTQALLGEPLEVTDERDGWVQVVLPWQPSSADARGYPGWVPAAHVGEPVATAGPRVVVAEPTERVGDVELSYGTILPLVDDADDGIRVAFPDGTVHSAPPTLVRVTEPSETPDIDSVRSLISSAAAFTGMRYLWGGTSGWGFDCSGLVHLVYRTFGHMVPRDAFDQLAQATPTDLSDATYGDLYFFGSAGKVTHVGFVTNEPTATRRILHAPDGDAAGRIEEVALPETRLAKLVAAGTFPPRPARTP